MVDAIPKGFHSVNPLVTFKDSRKAIEFYKRALDAKEMFVMTTPDGKQVTHATIMIGNSTVMMGDENSGQPSQSAETIGASPISFYVYVPDVDAAYKKAVAAGARSEQALQDMFWGDRIGTVKDPFGLTWTLATHTKDPSHQDLEKGVAARSEKAAR